MGSVDTGDLLLERGAEQAALEAALDRTAGGTGCVVVLEGPAGIGKTRLVETARRSSLQRDFLVARASGASLEQEFSLGAVRQLFEPIVAAVPDADALFVGAAVVAAPLCGRPAPPGSNGDAAPGAVLHGLYWLTVALADRGRPLALVCDDVHWFDGPSLRFLAYLANRIAELPVALVIGTRPPAPGPDGELLARLIAGEAVTRVRPAPLSDAAVAELVRSGLEERADQVFCDAVAKASRGNPFLVGEVVRATRAAGVAPNAASARRLTEVRAETSVMSRLGQLPSDSLEVARAAAILGADAHLRHVAALSGLDVDAAGMAADTLLRAEILGPERPLGFVHPLVASAVYRDLLPGDRSARHRRAAALLVAEHAPPDRIARHYMATEPSGDEQVVEVLVASARSALAQGATDVTIAQLRRALAEPPTPARRLGIVLNLGSAESFLLDAGAIDHLGEAIGAIADAGVRVLLATARAVALCVDGRPAEAVASLRALDGELADDADRRLELLAAYNFVGATGPTAAPLVGAEIAELLGAVGVDDDAPPGVLGVRAYIGACSGEDVDDVAALALRALSSVGDDDPMLPMWFHLPLAALVMADRDREAAAIIEQRLTAARRLGAPGQVSIALFLRAMVAFRAGDLDDAEADARVALDQCLDYGLSYVLPGPLAMLVDVLRERNDLAGAEAVLADHGYGDGDGDSLFHLFLLFARARLRGAQERWDESLADVERGWTRSLETGIRSPNLIAWRANRAFAMILSERQGDMEAEARMALDEAEASGSPRCRAEAQRVLAMTGAAGGKQLVEEAGATFAGLGARLEEARTRIAYSMARGVVGTPAAADALAEAQRLAERCGATRLAILASARLQALGVRRRLRPVSGVGALTASERRVAGLAADGRSNKEVAQALFVTVKTVETHLAHTFQKLGISTRTDLAGALLE